MLKLIPKCFISIFLFYSTVLFSDEAVQIATSNCYDATAFNNGRRMVRDYRDRRVVVYQDSIDNQRAVMLTYSYDGVNWATPIFLDYGCHPAIAITREKDFWITWSSADQTKLKIFCNTTSGLKYPENYIGSDEIEIDGGSEIDYPSIEIIDDDKDYIIHLVWQMKTPENNKTQIFYINIDFYDYQYPYKGAIMLSDSSTISKFPSITSDLEYERGYIPILWTDFDPQNGSSSIVGYFSKLDQEESEIRKSLEESPPITLPYTDGCAYPSTSVRIFDEDSYPKNLSVIAFSDLNTQKLVTGTYKIYSQNDIGLSTDSEYDVDPNTPPSADDTLDLLRSCAILWQNENNIYYGQTNFQKVLMDIPVMESENNEKSNHFLSVCYKTFRADKFDVVWTEGENPPYKIMYRRMPKLFPMIDPPQLVHANFPEGTYKKRYCENAGYYGTTELIEGELPPGLAIVQPSFLLDNRIIEGIPTKSGEFAFTLCARHSKLGRNLGRDIPAMADTMSHILIINNSAPQITSPGEVVINPGEKLEYLPLGTDAEDNPIDFSFANYPQWLSCQDSTISGNCIQTEKDTSFEVIATDGDMSSILKVRVVISGVDAVQDEEFQQTIVPKAFSLYQNYPNPFNNHTTIRFDLPQTGPVDISIYNIKGKIIHRFCESNCQAGTHSFVWDASSLSSGTYFFKMMAGEFVDVKKCIYIR